MNKILLTTRPRYDNATAYLSYYTNLVIKTAKKLGIEIKDFEEKNVTAKNVHKYLAKKDPKLLFINGHGNANYIEGHKGEVIFSINNLDLLKDKITYARACNAGINLGKKAVHNNNGCFIGYNTPFSFWMDSEHSATPAKDKMAALYLEPSNEIINLLVKGKTTEVANERSKDMMRENMKKILKMEKKKEPHAMRFLEVLWNNYEGQILHGNPNLTF